MLKIILKKIIWKFFSFKVSKDKLFIKFIDTDTQKLALHIGQELAAISNTKSPFMHSRIIEIEEIIKLHKVSKSVEIGTGLSTIAFSLLAKKYKFEHVGYEQNKYWIDLVKNKLDENNLLDNTKFILSKLIEYEEGVYLDHKIEECDLLYIDGPTIKNTKIERKKFNTSSGKPACYDAINYFKKSIFPKIILIDGRTSTVDLILESKYSEKYNFIGELIFAHEKNDVISMLKLKRHSMFILKQ